VFDPPAAGARPSFEARREHVARRLPRAERYRQRLQSVPPAVQDPVWVDEEDFDLARHVVSADASSLGQVVDRAMSRPLNRSRPLWELWIARGLQDGRIALVGKAHHCLVDGLAAVELAALMLDPEESPGAIEARQWKPQPPPGAVSLLANALAERAAEQLELVRWQARVASSPGRLHSLAGDARRAAAALAHAFGDRAPASPFNEPISPQRHLAMVSRPLSELREIRRRYAATVNDVVLAVCAGAVRRYPEDHRQPPVALKAMVPVSVREAECGSVLGNRIVFMFIVCPVGSPTRSGGLR